MKKLLIILIVVLGFSPSVIACSCAYKENFDLQQFVYYDLIVKAEVLEVVDIPEDYEKKVEIEVNEIFKGTLKSKTITIYTPLDGAACGLGFVVGQKWLIYLNTYENELHTGLCTRSQLEGSKKYNWCKDKRFIKKYRDFTGFAEDETAKGQLKNGLPIGEWNFYSRNGNLWKKEIYDSNSLTEETVFYNPDGSVR